MLSPFKPTPLEELIRAWFVKQAPRPTFAISYPDVALYFCNISKGVANNKPNPTDLRSEIELYLGVELPLQLAQEICDANEDGDVDLECVILIARLLANNLIPPPKLHRSVARIFEDQSGKHLREHLSSSDDFGAEAFEEKLSRLSKSI